MPGILSLALTLMGLAFGSLSIVAEAADTRLFHQRQRINAVY